MSRNPFWEIVKRKTSFSEPYRKTFMTPSYTTGYVTPPPPPSQVACHFPKPILLDTVRDHFSSLIVSTKANILFLIVNLIGSRTQTLRMVSRNRRCADVARGQSCDCRFSWGDDDYGREEIEVSIFIFYFPSFCFFELSRNSSSHFSFSL